MPEKIIIWDWNGTLLDDVNYSVKTINKILKEFRLPEISVEKYRQIFTFPVKDYYKKLGFDFSKNTFYEVGMEFINEYNKNLHTCKLNKNAKETVKELKNRGIKQIIISAREHNSLQKDLEHFGIASYFDEILGIDNNFAAGKEEIFASFLEKNGSEKSKIYLVGDTTHDCMIAQKFNLNFIHFTNGHQDQSHFTNCNIYKSISDLYSIPKII